MRIFKRMLALICLGCFGVFHANAQASLIGKVCYYITVEGAADARTDSMWVLIDINRFKITLFLPDNEPGKPPLQKIFVDDFGRKRSYAWPSPSGQPVTDSLPKKPAPFVNTQQYGALDARLGFYYEPAATRPSGSQEKILASIDYGSKITDYAFLGYQPIITDGRLVLEHVQSLSNGQKPRVYVYRIDMMTDVSDQFKLPGY